MNKLHTRSLFSHFNEFIIAVRRMLAGGFCAVSEADQRLYRILPKSNIRPLSYWWFRAFSPSLRHSV